MTIMLELSITIKKDVHLWNAFMIGTTAYWISKNKDYTN